MNVGDLVVRTYGEGRRPVALVVSLSNCRRPREGQFVKVKWCGSDKIEDFNSEYLAVISASR